MATNQLWLTLNRAGGGGSKSKDRKSKLRVKNQRLNEQRKRRTQGEEKQIMLFTNGFEPHMHLVTTAVYTQAEEVG